jgi:hypothetical protein
LQQWMSPSAAIRTVPSVVAIGPIPPLVDPDRPPGRLGSILRA